MYFRKICYSHSANFTAVHFDVLPQTDYEAAHYNNIYVKIARSKRHSVPKIAIKNLTICKRSMQIKFLILVFGQKLYTD